MAIDSNPSNRNWQGTNQQFGGQGRFLANSYDGGSGSGSDSRSFPAGPIIPVLNGSDAQRIFGNGNQDFIAVRSNRDQITFWVPYGLKRMTDNGKIPLLQGNGKVFYLQWPRKNGNVDIKNEELARQISVLIDRKEFQVSGLGVVKDNETSGTMLLTQAPQSASTGKPWSSFIETLPEPRKSLYRARLQQLVRGGENPSVFSGAGSVLLSLEAGGPAYQLGLIRGLRKLSGSGLDVLALQPPGTFASRLFAIEEQDRKQYAQANGIDIGLELEKDQKDVLGQLLGSNAVENPETRTLYNRGESDAQAFLFEVIGGVASLGSLFKKSNLGSTSTGKFFELQEMSVGDKYFIVPVDARGKVISLDVLKKRGGTQLANYTELTNRYTRQVDLAYIERVRKSGADAGLTNAPSGQARTVVIDGKIVTISEKGVRVEGKIDKSGGVDGLERSLNGADGQGSGVGRGDVVRNLERNRNLPSGKPGPNGGASRNIVLAGGVQGEVRALAQAPLPSFSQGTLMKKVAVFEPSALGFGDGVYRVDLWLKNRDTYKILTGLQVGEEALFKNVRIGPSNALADISVTGTPAGGKAGGGTLAITVKKGGALPSEAVTLHVAVTATGLDIAQTIAAVVAARAAGVTSPGGAIGTNTSRGDSGGGTITGSDPGSRLGLADQYSGYLNPSVPNTQATRPYNGVTTDPAGLARELARIGEQSSNSQSPSATDFRTPTPQEIKDQAAKLDRDFKEQQDRDTIRNNAIIANNHRINEQSYQDDLNEWARKNPNAAILRLRELPPGGSSALNDEPVRQPPPPFSVLADPLGYGLGIGGSGYTANANRPALLDQTQAQEIVHDFVKANASSYGNGVKGATDVQKIADWVLSRASLNAKNLRNEAALLSYLKQLKQTSVYNGVALLAISGKTLPPVAITPAQLKEWLNPSPKSEPSSVPNTREGAEVKPAVPTTVNPLLPADTDPPAIRALPDELKKRFNEYGLGDTTREQALRGLSSEQQRLLKEAMDALDAHDKAKKYEPSRPLEVPNKNPTLLEGLELLRKLQAQAVANAIRDYASGKSTRDQALNGLKGAARAQAAAGMDAIDKNKVSLGPGSGGAVNLDRPLELAAEINRVAKSNPSGYLSVTPALVEQMKRVLTKALAQDKALNANDASKLSEQSRKSLEKALEILNNQAKAKVAASLAFFKLNAPPLEYQMADKLLEALKDGTLASVEAAVLKVITTINNDEIQDLIRVMRANAIAHSPVIGGAMVDRSNQLQAPLNQTQAREIVTNAFAQTLNGMTNQADKTRFVDAAYQAVLARPGFKPPLSSLNAFLERLRLVTVAEILGALRQGSRLTVTEKSPNAELFQSRDVADSTGAETANQQKLAELRVWLNQNYPALAKQIAQINPANESLLASAIKMLQSFGGLKTVSPGLNGNQSFNWQLSAVAGVLGLQSPNADPAQGNVDRDLWLRARDYYAKTNPENYRQIVNLLRNSRYSGEDAIRASVMYPDRDAVTHALGMAKQSRDEYQKILGVPTVDPKRFDKLEPTLRYRPNGPESVGIKPLDPTQSGGDSFIEGGVRFYRSNAFPIDSATALATLESVSWGDVAEARVVAVLIDIYKNGGDFTGPKYQLADLMMRFWSRDKNKNQTPSGAELLIEAEAIKKSRASSRPKPIQIKPFDQLNARFIDYANPESYRVDLTHLEGKSKAELSQRLKEAELERLRATRAALLEYLKDRDVELAQSSALLESSMAAAEAAWKIAVEAYEKARINPAVGQGARQALLEVTRAKLVELEQFRARWETTTAAQNLNRQISSSLSEASPSEVNNFVQNYRAGLDQITKKAYESARKRNGAPLGGGNPSNYNIDPIAQGGPSNDFLIRALMPYRLRGLTPPARGNDSVLLTADMHNAIQSLANANREINEIRRLLGLPAEQIRGGFGAR